ncbi:hypothetical protein NDU88_002151 [Pleurodeles waltl]|uniref:Uncharacterized protein n=1 Tax=Pleurodeles waltl TaxID=8319 RepID=A0AAV7LFA0_PLEWA|nr:hypothetical protein NDU88_002151 [Pleurodeles waltl]
MKNRASGSKLRLPFERHPWTIVRHQGSLVVARCGAEELARNISAFNRYHFADVPPTAELMDQAFLESLQIQWRSPGHFPVRQMPLVREKHPGWIIPREGS